MRFLFTLSWQRAGLKRTSSLTSGSLRWHARDSGRRLQCGRASYPTPIPVARKDMTHMRVWAGVEADGARTLVPTQTPHLPLLSSLLNYATPF